MDGGFEDGAEQLVAAHGVVEPGYETAYFGILLRANRASSSRRR